jgi:hypothetical protein
VASVQSPTQTGEHAHARTAQYSGTTTDRSLIAQPEGSGATY